MTVEKLEDKVWMQDNIRIVVRCSSDTKVKDYPHKNAAQASWSVTKFIDNRITPLLNGQGVVVLMGDGEQPHGRTLLSSLRDSYKNR
jgi:hypothetical protein